MLFNKRACGCFGGNDPFMGNQAPMMPQAGYDGDGCGCGHDPVVEAPIEKCFKRDICHEVQHECTRSDNIQVSIRK